MEIRRVKYNGKKEKVKTKKMMSIVGEEENYHFLRVGGGGGGVRRTVVYLGLKVFENFVNAQFRAENKDESMLLLLLFLIN
jgi:hypothetical protein